MSRIIFNISLMIALLLALIASFNSKNLLYTALFGIQLGFITATVIANYFYEHQKKVLYETLELAKKQNQFINNIHNLFQEETGKGQKKVNVEVKN